MEAQEWLDREYPKNGICIRKEESLSINNFGKTREEITKLSISGQGLERNLDLSDFTNLEELNCSNNCLTNLNLNNCRKLKKFYCSNNYLTEIPYFSNLEKIIELSIGNNNFPTQNLSIFSKFRNLEQLYIGNSDKIYNHFLGSLEPLKDLNKLERLYIGNTDIDSG
jgi:Leucine-rich repeat (LRR) protein